jgi:hypothetical protein
MYAGFVAAGGYDDRRLWSDRGWEHLQSSAAAPR